MRKHTPFFAVVAVAAFLHFVILGMSFTRAQTTRNTEDDLPGYKIPAGARICGPNYPTRVDQTNEMIALIRTQGCESIYIYRTEPDFQLIYGIKVLVGE